MKHRRLPSPLRPGSVLAAAVLTFLVWLPSAAAQPDLAAAGRAFGQAQQAELDSNWAQAASFYELAYGIAPSPEALRGALKARAELGHDARAATHALELQRRHPTHEGSRTLANNTLSRLKPKLVQLTVKCSPAPCTLHTDGRALGADARIEHYFFVAPGDHEIIALFGSRATKPHQLSEQAGASVELSFEEPSEVAAPVEDNYADVDQPAPPSAPAEQVDEGDGGLHPAVFITGAVVTAGLAVFVLWSGLDTADANSHYEEAPTEQAFNDGVRLETRTNILVAITGAVGVTTILVGLFATDWGGDAEPADAIALTLPEVTVGPDGAYLLWQHSF